MRNLISCNLVIFFVVIVFLCQLGFAQETWKSKVPLEDFEYRNQEELANKFVHHLWSGASESQVILEAKTVQRGRSSLRIVYKPISSSGWMEVQKDLLMPLNWQDFSGVSFWLNGDASFSEVVFKFRDGDGDVWRSPWIKVRWEGWKEIGFGFSEFHPDVFDPQDNGNNVMNLENVKAVAIGIKGGVNSALFFDDIRLVSKKEVDYIKLAGEEDVPANFYLWEIEGFEYESENEFHKVYPKGLMGGSSREVEISLEQAQAKEGANALKVEFNPFTDTGWAMVKRIYLMPKDWSEASGISFWVLGDGSYDEFAITFTDADNETYQVPWIRLGWYGWKRFYYDFDFIIRDKTDPRKEGNRIFDQNDVKAITFIIRGGKPALIFLDNIGLSYQKKLVYEPVQYAGGIASNNKVYLYWESSRNPFLIKYNVYRQGFSIGSTNGLFFTDYNVLPDTKYIYEVSAVYSDGKESEKVKINVVTQTASASGKGRVEIKGDWIYVDGEKFFVKGVAYSPYRPRRDPRYDTPAPLAILERDMKFIREAGFNTLRTYDALSERELILAEKYGLMIIQGLCVPQNANFGSSALLEQNRVQIAEKVAWSRNHNNILFYLLTSEPEPNAILRSGIEETKRFFETLAYEVKETDPKGHVSLAYWERADYPQLPQFDIVSANIYRHGPVLNKEGTRYEDYIKWFKNTHANNKPFIITEFGYSVFRENEDYGGDSFEVQKEAALSDLREIIAGGATGACIYEWIDQWWRNSEYEDDAISHDDDPKEWCGILGIKGEHSNPSGTARPVFYAVKKIFNDFDYYYKMAQEGSKYDAHSKLKIAFDKAGYLSSQKLQLSFILKDKNNKPLRNVPIEYTITDTKNRIKATRSGKTGLRGIYKTKFALPLDDEDTILSIFATAYTKNGKHFANVQHVQVTGNKLAKGKPTLKVKVVSRPTFEISKAIKDIVVDGQREKIWDYAAPLVINMEGDKKPILKIGKWSGEDDLSAKVNLLWDEEALYLFADVKDDIPALNNYSKNNIANGDGIELFIGTDPENIPKAGYSSGDFQIVVGANEKAWIYGQAFGGIRNSAPLDSEVKVIKRENGYFLEAKIARNNFGMCDFSEGKELRFDIAVNDADENSRRECQLIWNGSQNNNKDSKYWGRAKLVGLTQ